MGCQEQARLICSSALKHWSSLTLPMVFFTGYNKRKQTGEECPRSFPLGSGGCRAGSAGRGLWAASPATLLRDRSCCDLASPLHGGCTCRRPNHPGSRAKLLIRDQKAAGLWSCEGVWTCCPCL